MTINIGNDSNAYRILRKDDMNYNLFFERGLPDSSNAVMSFTQDGEVGLTVKDPVTALHMTSPSDPDEMDVYLGSDNDLGYRMHKTSLGHLDFLRGSYSSGSNVMRLTSDGRLGVGTTLPDSTLHVEGDATYHGKIVVMDGQDGGSGRGIHMVDKDTTDFAMYMASAGVGKSITEGESVGGGDFDGEAFRVRIGGGSNVGFIMENASEQRLMSVRGSDGKVRFDGPVSFAEGLDLGSNITVNRIVFDDANQGTGKYYLEKIIDGTDKKLRLTLDEGGADESLQIWGNGEMRHTFDAAGNSLHTADVTVQGNHFIDGNFGLGTTTPQNKMDVIGGESDLMARFQSEQRAGLLVQGDSDGSGTTGGAYVKVTNDVDGNANGILSRVLQAGERGDGGSYTGTLAASTLLGTTDLGALQLGVDGSVRATIDSNGNLGLNTTSPAYRLDVKGESAMEGLVHVLDSNTDSVANALGSGANPASLTLHDGTDMNKRMALGWDTDNDLSVMQSYDESTTAPKALWLNPAGGTVQMGQQTMSVVGSNVGIGETAPDYRLHVDGDIYTTGEITTMSDARVKTDLRRLTNALDKVKQLKGYTYKRSDKQQDVEPENIEHTDNYIGFIAQELKEVVPEVVSYNKATDRYSVNYGNMTALLAESVNELSDKNAKLESTVEDLVARVEKLEKQEA